MPIRSLSVVISAETGQFTASMRSAATEVEVFARAATTAAAGLARFDEAAAVAGRAATETGAGAAAAATEVARLGTAAAAGAAEVARLEATAAGAAAGAERLGAASGTAAAGTARLDASTAAAAVTAERLGVAAEAASVGTARVGEVAAAASVEVGRLGTASAAAAGAAGGLESAAAAISQLDAAAVAGATSVSRLGTAGTTAARGAERIGTAATAAAAGLERLDAVAAASVAAIEAVGAASAQAATEVGALRTALTQVATRVERLAPAVVQLAPSLLAFGAAADAASGGTGRLAETATVAAAASGRLAEASAASAAASAASTGSLAASSAAISRVGTAAGGTVAQAARMEGAVAGSTSAISRLGTVGQAAQTGLMVVGVALIAAAAGAVKFEASMRNVASIDEQVQNSFKQTSQAVLDLAKDVPQSANTLASGLYNITSSGFYASDAMSILRTSAVAASAGLTTTDTASKAIVASLNAYGMKASDATRISDALFNTVNYGVISFEELTGAIAHSVGNAARAGVSIEQLGAGLATMTLSGMSASEAGVSMNNVLSKLIKPSTALSEATKKLGINLQQDLANPAIGLYGVFDKLQNSTELNVKTILAWFPEIRAARGAMALLSGEGANYERVIGEMGTQQANAGATMRVFAEQSKSTKHELEMLGNQIAVAGIELGTAMLPGINQAVNGLETFGGMVKRAGSEAAQQAAPGFRDLGDAIGNVGDIARGLELGPLIGLAAKIGLGALVEGFNQLGGALKQASGFLADNRVAVMGLAGAYAALKLETIVTGIYNLASAVVSAGIGAFNRFDAAVAQAATSVRNFGGGSLAAGFVAFSATAAVATAGIYLVAEAFQEAAARARDLAAVRDQVAQILKPVDGNTLASFQQARDKLADMTAAAVRQVQAGGDLVNNTLHLGVTMQEAGKATDELNQKQTAMTTNARTLGQQFNLSKGAVMALAQRYNIDLSQGMTTVDGKSGSLATRFGALMTSMTAAAGSGLTLEEAGKRIDTAMTSADQAVKDLNTDLDILYGRTWAAQQSADAFQTALNGISDKSSLATTSTGGFTTVLTGNSSEAIKNRTAILGAAEAAGQHAASIAKMTGSADAGNEVLSQMITSLIGLATQGGFSRQEVEELVNHGLTPLAQFGSIETQVSTPGATKSTAEVKDLGSAIGALVPTAQVPTSVPGATQATGEITGLGAAIGALSPTAQVPTSTPGAVQATGEINGLNSSLVLTPKDTQAKVSAPGAVQATGQANGLAAALGRIPRDISVKVHMYQDTPGALGASVGAMAATGGKSSGYATGGPIGGQVSGPGTGTSDSVPIMASNGEWVINSQAASGYGSRAMAAINDGTAQIVVPRGYASGGPITANPAAASASGAAAGAGAGSGSSSATRAVQLIASGATTLADVYAGAANGASAAARALRELTPRLWQADQNSATLTGTTSELTKVVAGWVGMLAAAATRTDGQRLSAAQLGQQMLTLAVGQVPQLQGAQQLATLASQAATLAQEAQRTGAVNLGAVLTLAGQTIVPALTAQTGLHTTASGANTTAVQLATTASGLMTQAVQLGTQTTDLGTQATTSGTAAVDLNTTASTLNTTAVQASTTATGEQTTATNTAATAATAFSGTVDTATGSLNTNAGAATAAAAAVRDYTAALAAIPANVTTTVTTQYVTVGAAGGAGFAGGGRISGPGTGTSDNVPIMASHGEWVIRAAAAARYGDRAMAAVNAGTAKIVHAGGAVLPTAAYAGGGRIGHYASGGMVRGDMAPVGGVVNNFASTVHVTVSGASGDPGSIAAAVRQEVNGAFSQLATRIGARPGRGR